MGAREESDVAFQRLMDSCKGIAEMLKTGEADRERAAYGVVRQLVSVRAEAAMPELVTAILGLASQVEKLRMRVEELEGSVRPDDQPQA